MYYAIVTHPLTGELLHQTMHYTFGEAVYAKEVQRIVRTIRGKTPGMLCRVVDDERRWVTEDFEIDSDVLYYMLIEHGIDSNQAYKALGRAHERTWAPVDVQWKAVDTDMWGDAKEENFRTHARRLGIDQNSLVVTDDSITLDGHTIAVSWERYRDNR